MARPVRLTRIFLGIGVALAAAMLLWTQVTHASSVWCVVPPGEPTGPYPTCQQVFTSLQTAVAAASAGDEVRVAAGTYQDVHVVDPYPWTQVVLIDKPLTIRGGYTAPFTAPPNFQANKTILDAQEQGAVIRVWSEDVTLQGLHLTGGAEWAIYLPPGVTNARHAK